MTDMVGGTTETAGTGRPSRSVPAAVVSLIVALSVGAAALGLLGHRVTDAAHRAPAWTWLPAFFALLVVSGWLIIDFRSRTHVLALDLFEAVLAPAIVAFPVAAVVSVVVVAKACSEVAHRVAPVKAAFNVAQWAFAAAAGSTLYGILAEPPGDPARSLAALVAAMAVVALANTAAFTAVMRLAQRRSLREVLRIHTPMIAGGWAVNVAFGIPFAAAVAWVPATVLLLAVPLVSLHLASRAYATAVADKARLADMHRALRALAAPVDPAEAIPSFLAEVQRCFGAEAVELVLGEDGGRTVHHLRAGEHARRIETREAGGLAAALLEHGHAVRTTAAGGEPFSETAALEGWRDCVAAPLVVDGRLIGMLCAYDASGLVGFEEGELAVMQALASEAAAMIQRGRLIEAVLSERRKLAEIVTSTSDGIATLGPDGTILTWNPGLERITGYAADEMLGQRLFGVLRPRDANDADVPVERWAEPDVTLPREIQIVSRENDRRWLSCAFTPTVEDLGRPRVLILVARDITTLREIEQLKDDFVATVSHELRTPLTPIKGWASTLVESGDRLDDEQRRVAAASIMRQADALERLITNLLEVAQIERGMHGRRGGTVEMGDVARRVVEEFRAAHPDRQIAFHDPGRACHAVGDELRVERILANLLSNAIKYAIRSAPIEVTLRESDGRVTLSVRDHGPGIPGHDHERIFERFQRLGNHMTRSQGGAGLGLYIARQLARSIGATLAVDSEVGRGTTFSLTLEGSARLIAIG